MTHGSGVDRRALRGRARPPVLGRMSVFLIGVVVGAALGGLAAALGAPLLDELYGAAYASAPPPAPVRLYKPATAPAPAPGPAQVLKVSATRPVVVGVFGDSMADGLWAGLYRQMADHKGYEVVRFSQAATGLTSYQYVDVQQRTLEQLQARQIDVAVVLFGANDEQGIAENGVVSDFGTPRWRAVYTRRIDALVGLLREHGAAVYWVGLPKMRRPGYEQKAEMLNAIYEERARALGAPFVPTAPVTVNSRGEYDDYLSADGVARPRLMRAKDGIHMTMAGYLRIAAPVSSQIRADVSRALSTQEAMADRPAPSAGAL